MEKNTKISKKPTQENERLAVIAETKLGDLSDDAILALLAERKHLEVSRDAFLARQKAEEAKEQERLRVERENAEQQNAITHKREALIQAIETLNQSISPDKTDNELLAFVKQRKALEKELEALGPVEDTAATPLVVEATPTPLVADLPVVEAPEHTVAEKNQITENASETPPPLTDISAPIITPKKLVTNIPSSHFQQTLKEDFGRESIQNNDGVEGGELARYLDQLKNNTGSLGTFLQEIPLNAKKNKAFMLKVAEIDPAYAMHYADEATLKRDEDFNIRIASMKNPRHSGNALAEMLPEARTSNVILAAVKQDYSNVKFIKPDMEAYDEILRIAKKATLEKLEALKEAADMSLIIPRPLQEDKQFMEEAKKVVSIKQGDTDALEP